MAHPWDDPLATAAAHQHPWGEPHAAGAWDAPPAEDPESSDDNWAPPTAGTQFVEYMSSMLLARDLNARQFCEAMNLAAQAGVAEAAPFGYRLGAPSGHYQRHVAAVFPEYAEDTYQQLCVLEVGRAKPHILNECGDVCGRPLKVVRPYAAPPPCM